MAVLIVLSLVCVALITLCNTNNRKSTAKGVVKVVKVTNLLNYRPTRARAHACNR